MLMLIITYAVEEMWFQKSVSWNAYVETRRGHFENIP